MTVNGQKSNFGCWLLAGLSLLIVLIVAIIINEIHGGITSEQIESGISIDNGDQKINWERYNTYDVELSDTYTITGSGVYHLTGRIDNGAVIINTNSEGVVKLVLDNVVIKNESGPTIVCYAADDLVIELIGDNVLIDGTSYNKDYNEDVKGAIYSKADLTLQGDGSLNITANYQDGIVSKDDLKFVSGSYYIIAADDAIRGKDSVYIVEGVFNLTARGDGIKSTNNTKIGKGFVLIEDGFIELSVGDDAIHAERSLIINDGEIDIAKSYEGLEAQNILINDGTISILASDDGINAGGGSENTTNRGGGFEADANCAITIEGGDIYINASGDGIDSNGYIYFNGGEVVVDGPTNNGNGALDAGISINQTGGSVIAFGYSGMAESLGSTSSVYNISVYLNTIAKADTEIVIKDSKSNPIFSESSAKPFNHIALGTEDFVFGETYTIYLDDAEYKTFTISEITTTIGEGANAMQPSNMQPGGRPDMSR